MGFDYCCLLDNDRRSKQVQSARACALSRALSLAFLLHYAITTRADESRHARTLLLEERFGIPPLPRIPAAAQWMRMRGVRQRTIGGGGGGGRGGDGMM